MQHEELKACRDRGGRRKKGEVTKKGGEGHGTISGKRGDWGMGEMEWCWKDERCWVKRCRMNGKGKRDSCVRILLTGSDTDTYFWLCEKSDPKKLVRCRETQCQHNKTEPLGKPFISPSRIPTSSTFFTGIRYRPGNLSFCAENGLSCRKHAV